MKVQHFFDQDTNTLTYVIYDSYSRDAIIIDPVLNFDNSSGKITYTSVKELYDIINLNQLKIHFILETHAHADHLSSSQALKKYFPYAQIGISSRIKEVQEVFKPIFNFSDQQIKIDDFDYLINDRKAFKAGSMEIMPFATPGHTPACMSFLIGNNLFTGDALFMPDYGTGRCDFPKGSAFDLYHSVKKLYELPDETNVFVGHDYLPNNRELKFQTTIGESKKNNIQLNEKTNCHDYVQFRETRDKNLKAPRLLFPSLQVNIAAGKLPLAESNGSSYLKIPLS